MFGRVLGVMRSKRVWPVLIAGVIALIVGAAAPNIYAQRQVIPYDDLQFFIEVNSTDGDAGVQLKLDGEQWKELKIHGADGRKLLDVNAKRSLKTQGLTEFFFESAEPSFEDVSLEEFLGRFPEGEYRFSGKTIDGDRMAGTALLTHDIPEGPVITSPEDGEVVESDDVEIEWEPVTSPAGIEIVTYEVIVFSDEAIGEFRVLLPASATSVEVPEEIFDAGVTEYSFEILAREVSGNQTITEGEFEIEFVADDDDEDDEAEDVDVDEGDERADEG